MIALIVTHDDGKWFSAKVFKQNAKLQANCSLSSFPFVPSTGWRAFPSQNIPSLFNYGHVHYYALESVEDINGAEEIKDRLGHMMDKPLKNGRKYVDSGFVHDIRDVVNGERYFMRAHVDENRAATQCYCCDICEQWRCSSHLMWTLSSFIFRSLLSCCSRFVFRPWLRSKTQTTKTCKEFPWTSHYPTLALCEVFHQFRERYEYFLPRILQLF